MKLCPSDMAITLFTPGLQLPDTPEIARRKLKLMRQGEPSVDEVIACCRRHPSFAAAARELALTTPRVCALAREFAPDLFTTRTAGRNRSVDYAAVIATFRGCLNIRQTAQAHDMSVEWMRQVLIRHAPELYALRQTRGRPAGR